MAAESYVDGELARPLERLLGKKSAGPLERELGLTLAGQLLHHFPHRYFLRGELTDLDRLPADEEVTIVARVVSTSQRTLKTRSGMILDVVLTDNTGRPADLRIGFFNGWTAKKELLPGTLAMFAGKVGAYQGHPTLTNPAYELLVDDELASHEAELIAAQPVPVYPATVKLQSWKIQRAMAVLLDQLDLETLTDPVPADVVARERLQPLAVAYESIHRPAAADDWQRARHRFRYQEALTLQAALATRRMEALAQDATARPGAPGALLAEFDSRLPYTLTEGQRGIGQVLARELAAGHSMHRLLQGEVGSGKTVVALRAMLQVIDSGGQAAFLAPTEVLATQHLQSINALLGELGQGTLLGGPHATQVVLLTGSMTATARKKALLAAASGEAGIVVGTHALLSDNVQFADLGLVVVDEQHRFGVEQRDALRAKAARPPHLLVMTATPIPRTVAMTVFGDMEVSELTELPAGRAPISTVVVGLTENPGWEKRLWTRAREEIDAGRQVYVVCPKIGDDEPGDRSQFSAGPADEDSTTEMAGVLAVVDYLRTVPALAGSRIEPLHGRLDTADKSSTMAQFAAGGIDVLVSTTVIEVGVDVHNASLMVILDADRFGMSQLHQLRGRVGRGGLPGLCLLVTRLEPGHPSRRRLDAVAATTDGFLLAREDLEMRREGDILGASQSGGRSGLRLLRVLQHEDIIIRAREDAAAIVAQDPQLERHQALRAEIELYLNAEAQAFLERG